MPEPSDLGELPPDVVDALRRGRKADAIRRLRELHGVEPAEARALVELHAPSNRQEPGLTVPTRGLWAGWIVTVVAIGLILYALLTYAV